MTLHFLSEPWRFYTCGPETKAKLCGLNEDKRKAAEPVRAVEDARGYKTRVVANADARPRSSTSSRRSSASRTTRRGVRCAEFHAVTWRARASRASG